jgi:hypothetical protein
LQKLCEWGKEALTAEELNKKTLLPKDNFGYTAWHLASTQCKLEVLHKRFEWGKGRQSGEEGNNNFSLAKENGDKPPGITLHSSVT